MNGCGRWPRQNHCPPASCTGASNVHPLQRQPWPQIRLECHRTTSHGLRGGRISARPPAPRPRPAPGTTRGRRPGWPSSAPRTPGCGASSRRCRPRWRGPRGPARPARGSRPATARVCRPRPPSGRRASRGSARPSGWRAPSGTPRWWRRAARRLGRVYPVGQQPAGQRVAGAGPPMAARVVQVQPVRLGRAPVRPHAVQALGAERHVVVAEQRVPAEPSGRIQQGVGRPAPPRRGVHDDAVRGQAGQPAGAGVGAAVATRMWSISRPPRAARARRRPSRCRRRRPAYPPRGRRRAQGALVVVGACCPGERAAASAAACASASPNSSSMRPRSRSGASLTLRSHCSSSGWVEHARAPRHPGGRRSPSRRTRARAAGSLWAPRR